MKTCLRVVHTENFEGYLSDISPSVNKLGPASYLLYYPFFYDLTSYSECASYSKLTIIALYTSSGGIVKTVLKLLNSTSCWRPQMVSIINRYMGQYELLPELTPLPNLEKEINNHAMT